ncbi:hypothetical protein [Clostridium butyricum]|uniref:hypothetical protein n=1 Tax=Clostridium butyricum TaxID=1492 RepID=UPI0024B8858B|nr:hypothetical protein [Clostridium butyricum]
MKKLGVFVITITLIIGTCGTGLQKSIFPSSRLFFSRQISEELNYIKVNDEKDESEKKLLSTYGKQVFELIIPLTLYSIIAPEPEFNDNNVDYNEKVAIELFNLPEERFFLFGMGKRKKLIYKDFKIIDIFTGEIIEEFQGEKEW